MKRRKSPVLWVLAIVALIVSCEKKNDEALMEQYKDEIVQTEKAFAQMVKEAGIKAAFLAFAADDAVLNRAGRLIEGKAAIEQYFDEQTARNVRLEWTPDFVYVSASGDLAYTYGPYEYEATDEAGNIARHRGIFHTVWRKEAGGEWRYVWD